MIQSASRPQHVEPSKSDLKYRTHMKHMYNLILLIRINSNDRHSNEILVSVEIRTSDVGGCVTNLATAPPLILN
jgi:hypothetical protein